MTIRQDSDRVDTIRIETFRDHYHTFYVRDSIDTYKAIADSLRQVLNKDKETVVEKKKRVPTWQKLAFLAIVILVCICVIKSKTND